MRIACAVSYVLLALSPAASFQSTTDTSLLSEIAKIPAIDNHSHPMPVSAPAPLPNVKDVFGKTGFEYPVRLRLDNPEYSHAWKSLYGYAYDDMTPAHALEALRAKRRIMSERGEAYPSWVLDRAGIKVALANVPPGPGLTAPRFLIVPHADQLLFPLDPDAPEPPETLVQYCSEIVTPTLERWKRDGAVAIKFALAYRRSLDFHPPSEEEAERLFMRAAGFKEAPADDYRELQDYLFAFIAREAGRIGLAVHIHVGVGADPYFNIAGANPLLLEPVLNDPSMRKTRFVLIHGGWPFEKEAGLMLMKPNVYADFSAQTFLRSDEALAEMLKGWLEWYPEKILFGSDAYSEKLGGGDAPLADWEEKIWLGSRTARRALAIALTRMIEERQISRARALELARMVLHDNAARLYGLK